MTGPIRSWRDVGVQVTTLPLLTIMTLFFMIPLAMTAVLSFQATQYYRLIWTWDLQTWVNVFTHSHYWSIMLWTVFMALICVALCLLIGFPVAYALVHRLRHLENHVKILIVFAFLTDHVLKTFGWVLLLDRTGVLNGALQSLGFGSFATNFLFTPGATLLGMVYNLLPYTIFTIYLSVARIDRDLMRAAYDAGASRRRIFLEITLPLCKPGLIAGGVLVFVLSLGVFLEPKVLGGGLSPMAAELIRQSFETRVNWPLGAALTLVVITLGSLTLAAAGMILTRRTARREVSL